MPSVGGDNRARAGSRLWIKTLRAFPYGQCATGKDNKRQDVESDVRLGKVFAVM